jgi:hypothetical protein
VKEVDCSQEGVPALQTVVNLQGPFRTPPRFREGFSRAQIEVSEQDETLGEANVRQAIILVVF